MAASQLTFNIQTPGATYSVTGRGGFADSGTIGSNGIATTAASYSPGVYQISYSYQGVAVNDDFTVVAGGSTVFYFNPVAVTDPGTSGGAPATVVTGGSAASPSSANPTGPATSFSSSGTAPVPAQSSSSSYPFSWPPYNYGKYFTPTQAFMYVGGLYIDELNGFQYTLQSNRIPIFGYSSRRMDAVGKGKSLVQGQFTINFISEGYLYTVLDQYGQLTVNPQAADEQAALNIQQQITALQSSDPNSAVQSQIASLKQQLLQLLANNSSIPSVLSNAQNSSGSQDYDPTNHDTPFDIVMQFEGGGRTVTRTLKGCVITSNEQVLGDNDTTVLDAYGFIARSIK